MIRPGVLQPSIISAVCGVFGAIVGTVFNSVIHRIPDCGATIAFHKTRTTKKCQENRTHSTTRYPVIEALTALLFAAVAWQRGLSLALGFDLAFIAALIALVFIDAEHMILPNAITYPGIIIAVVTRIGLPYVTGPQHFDDLPGLLTRLPQLPLWSVSLIGAAIGALVGGGSLWLLGFLWEKVRKVPAMGLGDVKMMTMVGAYLGWRQTLLTIFVASLTGSLAGISFMVYQRKKDFQMHIPFGVFLAIGAIVSLLIGTKIIEWYAGQF